MVEKNENFTYTIIEVRFVGVCVGVGEEESKREEKNEELNQCEAVLSA